MPIQVSEVRYLINDIRRVIYTLKKLKIPKTSILHLRDEIWGSDEQAKVKVTYSFDLINDVIFYQAKFHPSKPVNYRKEKAQKVIYQGCDFFQLQHEIQKYYLYRLENILEKIQLNYVSADSAISLDIYSHGTWITIKSTENKIWEWSQKLGFDAPKNSCDYVTDDFEVHNPIGFPLTKNMGQNNTNFPTFAAEAKQLNQYLC